MPIRFIRYSNDLSPSESPDKKKKQPRTREEEAETAEDEDEDENEDDWLSPGSSFRRERGIVAVIPQSAVMSCP